MEGRGERERGNLEGGAMVEPVGVIIEEPGDSCPVCGYEGTVGSFNGDMLRSCSNCLTEWVLRDSGPGQEPIWVKLGC